MSEHTISVLHVLNELKPSGAETMLQSAAPMWLPKSDHSILSTGSEVGTYAKELGRAGYCIHHIPFARSVRFFREFGSLLRAKRFDVVHVHAERGCTGYVLAARLAMPRIRIVRTVHHIFYYSGGLRIRKALERRAAKLLGAIMISNSPAGQQNERRRLRSSNDLIPNWYDSTKYVITSTSERNRAREEIGIEPHECLFVSVGGNQPYKNYLAAIEACAVVADAGVPLRYVHVGFEGPGTPLTNAARHFGVDARFQSVGVVEDPRPLLRAGDAFLMPSTEEGFGIAAVEAMATGIPAILSDVEALCDFRETIGGVLFTHPSPRAIAEALEKMARIPSEQRRAMGRQAAAAVACHYSPQRGAQAYLDLYCKAA